MQNGTSAQTSRVRAAGRDQAFMRELNERIAALQPSGMFIEFACECARRGCRATVPLGVDEFEGVGRFPGRFVISPGHTAPTERVVELHARYAVVEATGAGKLRAPAPPAVAAVASS
jgi:hypothetical protein